MADTRLILHVKGTESQTTELPKNVVRAGIAEGQISRSQLIWSAAHNAWKQVRELPHLLPSQKLAPAPARRVGTVPLPKPVEGAPTRTGSVPKIAAVKPASEAAPAAVKASARPTARVAIHAKAGSPDHLVVKEEGGFQVLKWICLALALAILATLAINYLTIDRPLVSRMSQTPYAQVAVYAHLGAFIQPGALVVHVRPTPALTAANLADFLQVLAHNTPAAATSDGSFDYVALTTGWTGRYTFSGYVWREFGLMGDKDEAQKEAFLLDQLRDSSGRSLVSPEGTLDSATQQAERDKVWAQFAAYFTQA